MRRTVQFLSHALALIAALAVGMMMIHVMADVLGKYLLNQPVPGTAEVVANYYMITAVFLPLAWVEATNAPIVVELVYDRLGPVARHRLLVLADMMSIAFYAALAWLSWTAAVQAWRIGERVEGMWRVTTWPAKFMLPVGLVLACLLLILRLLGGEKGRAEHAHSVDI